ncbi:MAG: chemotaxis protein CheW [Pseudomonadota bacterium]
MSNANLDTSDCEIEEENEGNNENRFLTFKLGDEEYGLEINYVKEVVGLQKITAMPDVPRYIKGIINLRGQVIPIMDARARFNLSEKAYNDRTCVVVIDVDTTYLGLIVDEVKDVLEIPEEKISAPPKMYHAEKSQFIRGLGKHDDAVKILLDVSTLFDQSQ